MAIIAQNKIKVKEILKKGKISVNGIFIKDGRIHINEKKDIIKYEDKVVGYKPFVYIMMNKPKGVVSATEDSISRTVIDLLEEKDCIFEPFPVGRLDKDTEGLMLLTNDGNLGHQLTSPKKDVEKQYYVEVSGVLKVQHIPYLKEGIILEDGYKCKSAKLDILTSDVSKSTAYIYVTEGKFHQVKRMMKALGCEVTYLKRLSIGELVLDETLELGKYRYLTEQELKKLKN